MAKLCKNMAFKNVVISLKDMTLTEFGRDNCEEFNLMDILQEWDGVQGVSISFKQESELSFSENEVGGDDE